MGYLTSCFLSNVMTASPQFSIYTYITWMTEMLFVLKTLCKLTYPCTFQVLKCLFLHTGYN